MCNGWCILSALLFIAMTMGQGLGHPCNPAYVQQQGMVLTVAPTGVDDTTNLRCAIDYAATLGPGVTVQLTDYTYKTAQLVVQRFNGTIRGMGRQKTIVRNTDTTMVIQNPTSWLYNPPAYDNLYPTFIIVIGNDVAISDLTIQIVGQNPTSAWYFSGGPFYFVIPALGAWGSNMSLLAQRIDIVGSDKCVLPPTSGFNLAVGVEFWQFAYGPTAWVSSSSVVIEDSTFRCCTGIYAAELVNSKMVVTGNSFYTFNRVLGTNDIWGSHIEFSDNTINGLDNPPSPPSGIQVLGKSFGIGFRDSSLLVRNNRFSGLVGVYLDDNSFHGAISCGIVGNNIEHVTDIGYWFRPGTYGCTVVGHGKGTVLDETGGAHMIVGVTPHTGGVGQDLSNLLRHGKWPWLW
jgi:hypothetical protein